MSFFAIAKSQTRQSVSAYLINLAGNLRTINGHFGNFSQPYPIRLIAKHVLRLRLIFYYSNWTKNYKHLKGLYLLSFLEMCNCFAHYGLRAILVLYMVNQLFYAIDKTGQIYGLFIGLMYLTPIIGGWFADKYLGQRKSITIGCVLMCLGLFLTIFNVNYLFLLSLLIMIIANGFLKSNLSALLGMLYDNNTEKDRVYTIYFMGINVGAFIGPLVCGTFAVKYGFKFGLLATFIVMFLGFIVYKILENKYLADVGKKPIFAEHNNDNPNQKLMNDDKSNLRLLFTLMIFSVIFLTCFEQSGFSLTLFALNDVSRIIGNYEILVPYFQSLNPLFVIIFAPLLIHFWNLLKQNNKEPLSTTKFILGLGITGITFFLLTFICNFFENSTVPFFYLVIVYFLMTIAELNISPIGISLVSKFAPKKFLSLMMGCWFMTNALGGILAGFIGGIGYQNIGAKNLFLLLAIISSLSFVILFLLMEKIFIKYFNKS